MMLGKVSQMKRICLLLLALVLSVCMTACGSQKSVSQTSADKIRVSKQDNEKKSLRMKITVNGKVMQAKLVDNSSTEALVAKLKEKPVTIEMQDFSNFEKVGDLGFTLPTNDENIVTGPGDLILYQGSRFVIYYDTNKWNFTRLGRIEGMNQAELVKILGSGNVKATLSL